MKIIYLFLLLCFSFSFNSVWATDPFDTRQKPSTNSDPNTKLNVMRCHKNQQRLFSETPFKQLKIVGILGLKSQKQILLQNEEQRITTAKEGNLVGQEGYKLQKIEHQAVQFLTWKKDCRTGEMMTVNF